jgi:hypothetical protein
MLIFLLGIVSILMIRVERTAIMAATGVYIVIPTVYYFVYARHQQTFSDAEKAVMLPAHAEVKNANGEFDFSFVYIPKFDDATVVCRVPVSSICLFGCDCFDALSQHGC